MGLTKTEKFTDFQNDFADFAKALAHPARIAIIQHLLTTNSCICGDIVEELGLAQSTISQHLKALKNMELIQGNIDGTSVCYCINPIKFKEIQELFGTFFTSISTSQSCC